MTMPFGHLTVAVASGKGGTGKTLVATNLALAASRAGSTVTLVDCDVEAPNDALFLVPTVAALAPVEVPLAEVDAARCTLCGACRDACAYGAVRILGGSVMVFSELCHGCGACLTACPTGAMGERLHRVGEIEWGPVSRSRTGLGVTDVVTGRLDIGEVKAPSVIREARRRGGVFGRATTVLDAPPGVACSAVAAVRGADVLVLVTEPTPFGMHDLELAVELGRQMDVPMGVVINRLGTGDVDVEAYCARESLPVLAGIPFDRRVAEIYARGGIVLDEHPDAPAWFEGLWAAVRDCAEGEPDR